MELLHESLASELRSLFFGFRFHLLIGCALLALYWNRKSRPRKAFRFPPGPPNLPLVGSLPFLGTDIREPLKVLAERYGEIMTVHLGSNKTVFLNTFDVIKDAFVKNGHSFAGRPDIFHLKELCYGKGIISSNGNVWKEQRRFTHTALKDLGMGKGVLEPKVLEEIQYLLEYLDEVKGKPIDPYRCITTSVADVIISIVDGKNRKNCDKGFNKIMENLEFAFEAVAQQAGAITVFPFLRYLPGDFFSVKKLLAIRDEGTQLMLGIVDSHKKSQDESNLRNFVDVYLDKMKADKNEIPPKESTFCEDQLAQVLSDLFGAGTETTANTLLWSIIYMLNFPGAMKRCQEEIEAVIGKERMPSMQDKNQMPYVQSTIREVQRMANVVVFGVMRATTEDVEFRGYHFPAGTMVMPNLYAIHYDPVLWPESYKFKPERHLGEDGTVLKRDELMPFSIGRRVCVGESLAKMELFLCFTSLLQNFEILLPEGEPMPSLTGKLGATNLPPKHKVIFKRR